MPRTLIISEPDFTNSNASIYDCVSAAAIEATPISTEGAVTTLASESGLSEIELEEKAFDAQQAECRMSSTYHAEGIRYWLTEFLAVYMDKNSISKKDLAKKLDMNYRRLCMLQQGGCDFSLDDLVKVSRGLMINIDLHISCAWENVK